MSLQTKTCSAIRRELPVQPSLLASTVTQNDAYCASSGFPFGAYLTRHAVKGALGEFGDQKPGRIDRPRHHSAFRRHGFETGLAIVRLIADQDDQPVSPLAG